MPNVLYIAYWGALEPLGQSLIIPAVIKLAEMGAHITLVTFEKPHDLADKVELKRVQSLFKAADIRWHPLKYHKNPRNPATAFDIAHGIARGLLHRLGKNFDIVHARTYTGGLIGLLLAPLIGAKFVYHNEGFYPDERVDGGVWAYNSRSYKISKWLENRMYARADAIIALSNRAIEIIEKIPEVRQRRTPVIFVPSCVDLEHFKFPQSKLGKHNGEIKFVYIGSVGNSYNFDDVGRFLAAVNKEKANVHLQIFSKASPELIKTMLQEGGLPESAWSLRPLPYSEMPSQLAHYDVGLFFLKDGIGSPGCSPTKVGEYWAMGLPVITTPNVSDTDIIVRREKIGVVVEKQTTEAYLSAFQEIQELLKDSGTAQRCRAAAEKYYALLPACERQIALYRQLLGTQNAPS